MFLEDSDFEEEDDYLNANREPISSQDYKKSEYEDKIIMRDVEEDDFNLDEDENFNDHNDNFGIAGGIPTPNSSRARMLAQQRELQLKKRQASIQTSGKIRSSLEDGLNNNFKSSKVPEKQFTPAVRQFSAPKAVKESATDEPNNSEFSRISASNLLISENNSKAKSKQQPNKWNQGKKGRDSSDDDDDDDDNISEEESFKMNKPPTKSQNMRKDDYDHDRRYDHHHNNNHNNNNRERHSTNPNFYQEQQGKTKHDEWEDAGARQPKTKNDQGPMKNDFKNDGLTKERLDRERMHAQQLMKPFVIDLSDMRNFLNIPVPKAAGIVQCYIRRNKSGATNKLFPVYSLYLKEGDTFLLTSKKRPKNKTSNYLVSMRENDFNREGNNYMGKLRSNFVGTEFQVFDDGFNPKDIDEKSSNNSNVRKELAGIMYAANVLGSRGPRKMQVAIPAVDENNHMLSIDKSGDEDLIARIKDKNFRDLVYMINKPPRWNDQVGAYVLNFNGRVTMASVKNFQLVDPDEQNSVLLQFGRVGKDEFTMDFQWPLSPLQAFSITLSSFDSKIACD